jgi:hypothetical protein
MMWKWLCSVPTVVMLLIGLSAGEASIRAPRSPEVVSRSMLSTPSSSPTNEQEANPVPDSCPTSIAGEDVPNPTFLSLARDAIPGLRSAPDASLLELGRSGCESYDRGALTTEIRDRIAASA